MKVVIPGGSGQVGAIAGRAFEADGHEVVVLAHDGPGRAVRWDGRTLGPWAAELDGADVVLNLAGRSVDCRYTPANRREIMDSRTESTRVVGEAIAAAGRPPAVWLQASTATIYAHRYDAPNDEAKGILGGDEPDAPDTWRFSIDVARSWEEAAAAACPADTRLVLLRSAMIMSPDRGGVFDTLYTLVRRGLGGTAADGRQYLSWVHDADFMAALRLLIEREDLDGPVNVASPEPLPNAEFMRELRRAAGARVVPGRLLEAGMEFAFPRWPEAAGDLVARRRAL